MVAKSVSHRFEATGSHCLLGIYKGIESFQGFLGGAKWISSIHSSARLFRRGTARHPFLDLATSSFVPSSSFTSGEGNPSSEPGAQTKIGVPIHCLPSFTLWQQTAFLAATYILNISGTTTTSNSEGPLALTIASSATA